VLLDECGGSFPTLQRDLTGRALSDIGENAVYFSY
jgi:hypothetical protein